MLLKMVLFHFFLALGGLQSMGSQESDMTWTLNHLCIPWCMCCCCWVASVVSDSVWPLRRQPTRLPRPWDSLGKNTGVGCHFLLQCMKVKSQSEVTQSCPTLCNPVDCSPPGPSIHGISQARILEWVAISFSRESSQPRDWTWSLVCPALAGRFFTTEPRGNPN